jgi:D-alanine--poly(phosphoribitol) ligase subunit 1
LNILERISHWSKITPERPAHVSGEHILTYRALEQNIDTLATYLSSSLPNDHSPVAVIGHKEPEILIAFLASVKSGHPYIPIDISTPQQRIDTIIERSQAAECLTIPRVKELLAELPISTPIEPCLIKPEDPWYIIFTSGSTGEPKGVVITTDCLNSFVEWMLAEQHFQEQNETFLNQAPFSFDLTVMDLYLSLVTGGTLFSITRDEISNPRQLFIALAQSNASVWVSTPTFAQMCLTEPTFSLSMLPRIKKFLFCGEVLPPNVAVALIQRFPNSEVWNTYGPTEATCATTSIQITPGLILDCKTLPVGYPKPDCHIIVAKAEGGIAEEDELGEILISGSNVSPGYLNRPDLTKKAFTLQNETRTYHTGDRGHYHQGMLFFDGRMDTQIKLHGYRIELGDIESNLQELPSIMDVVVIPHLTEGQADFLAAFVILEKGNVLSEFENKRTLKRELEQRLPVYMVPQKFYFVEHFPMTINGKVDRRRLEESFK